MPLPNSAREGRSGRAADCAHADVARTTNSAAPAADGRRRITRLLRHDDGVVRLQQDVLLEPLAASNLVVVEPETGRLSILGAQNGDVLRVGEVVHTAS